MTLYWHGENCSTTLENKRQQRQRGKSTQLNADFQREQEVTTLSKSAMQWNNAMK